MTQHNSSLAPSRIFLLIVLLALLLACVTISFVTGPTEVGLGYVATYVVDVTVDIIDNVNGSWMSYLAVDVPEGWTFHSCNYEGDVGGSFVMGVGIEYDPPGTMECEQLFPPVSGGYQRIWIETETHNTTLIGGWARAIVRFHVNGSQGDHTLAFQIETHNLTHGETDCSYTSYLTITVLEGPIFSDDFESGDTSAWSAVGP